MKSELIIGNWKMHLSVSQASLLVRRLHKAVSPHRGVEVVLAPSLLALQPLSLEIDRRRFKLAAQNAYFVDEGAYTGEVSFTLLRGLVDYCIIGHSERRLYFNETNEIVRDKVQAAVRNNIRPVICIGETQPEKLAGISARVIHDQLTTALANLTAREIDKVVVAYEPVWAISTFNHQFAKPTEVEAALKQIKSIVADLYGPDAASEIKVIYGGSVTSDIAPGYLELEDCEGLLVGAAALNYRQFADIVAAAYRAKHLTLRGRNNG